MRPCRAVCGMRKQDEPLLDKDGSKSFVMLPRPMKMFATMASILVVG
jgi:hypothetical protein